MLKKKQLILWESHWTFLRHSMKKAVQKKLLEILNDPTHSMRHYFDSRCNNRSGRFLLPKTNINCYRAWFLPSALSVFSENYKALAMCVHASGHLQRMMTFKDSQREDGGCIYLMILINLRAFNILCFCLSDFEFILGQFWFARY